MRKRVYVMALVLLFAALFAPQGLQAQVSVRDTFRIVDAVAKPGSVVPIKLYVANDSLPLGSLTAFVRIDTNIIKFDGIYDVDPYTELVTFYVNDTLIERGLTDPQLFDYTLHDITMISPDSVTASMLGLGIVGELPPGRGNIMHFFVRVKEGVALGTTTQIRLYHPDDVEGDERYCSYSDITGVNPEVRPTLVSGTLTVDTGYVPPVGVNHPPVIGAVTSPIAAQPNTLISFVVSASDADAPQPITLRATGLPSGATFGSGGQVTGPGVVSGTFNWTPNIAQSGSFVVTFTCVDDSGAVATPRSVTINVSSITPNEDLLFSASSKTFKLYSGGIPGLTGIPIPVNLADVNEVFGVQFDFLYDYSVFTIDSLVATERLTGFTVYDNVGVNPGRVRVVAFAPDNAKIGSGVSSTIFNFWVTIRDNAISGESPIRFENAWEAISPSPSVPSVELKYDSTGVFIVDRFGDVNGDQRVDVADAVVMVGYIIGDQTFTPRQFNAGNIDRNGVVDVLDLVAIINVIFGGSPSPSPQWNGPEAVVKLDTEQGLVGLGNVVQINAELPTNVAGIQLEIGYNPSKVQFMIPRKTELSQNLDFRFRDNGRGRLILLLYPTAATESYIAAGSGTVIKLPVLVNGELASGSKDIRINNAVLADPNAIAIPVKGVDRPSLPADFSLEQNYPNPFNPQTTIDFAVSADASLRPVRLIIYNVLGAKVATLIDEPLAAGKYSVQWFGRSDKGDEVASGVYFYRLTVGDQAQTRKMVLLK